MLHGLKSSRLSLLIIFYLAYRFEKLLEKVHDKLSSTYLQKKKSNCD